MSLPFIETFKGMITSPGETIQKSSSGTLTDSIIYFLIVIFVYSILTAVITYLLGASHPMPLKPINDIMGMIEFIIGFVILWTIILIIFATIIHICTKILGGKGDYGASIRAYALAQSPTAVIGWIPFINLLAVIWIFILMVMGIRDYHGISTIRAVIAVLLPVIVIIILAVLGLMFFMIDPTSVTVTEIPSVTF
ncbi:YIP1 family protein [Methanocalculus sp. MC3]